MDGIVIVFLTAILIVGALIFLIVVSRGKTTSVLDVDKYRSSWLSIEQSVVKSSEASYSMAILQADSLLDQALKQRGFKGQTMGERMKSANDVWKDANVVWSAHKLRNRIAHESSVTLTYDQTRRTLACFKQALKDMGAI
jgi:hypothetical protein